MELHAGGDKDHGEWSMCTQAQAHLPPSEWKWDGAGEQSLCVSGLGIQLFAPEKASGCYNNRVPRKEHGTHFPLPITATVIRIRGHHGPWAHRYSSNWAHDT